MSNNNRMVVRTENLRKDLKMGEVTVHAVRGVTLAVEAGEFLGIIGPSGSGKSTLLGLIGGLDTPTEGRIFIDGEDITDLSERALTRVRNEKIGFVFQFFNLVPTLTALENVALPVQFARDRQFNPTRRAEELLELLGLGDRMKHRPSQLSGGQQQRVALARALANNPPLLLCDEPTGNLDSESSEVVMRALRSVQQQMNTTVVVVTHDMDVASQMDRLVSLVDGRIAEDIDARSTAQLEAVRIMREKRKTGELAAVKIAGEQARDA
ncbi:MAG: ABC transporter ATP-binding protein [Chloroflexota bacterium]|jgi:putative ABC transport system ATP-binding protein|nr:ABC transporter ATP-binding protein [Anaerolineae bacterium]HMM29961.1 ABC transporter ATP-binding protein [Aggregatilineaceae bacterium]